MDVIHVAVKPAFVQVASSSFKQSRLPPGVRFGVGLLRLD
jgi:hypothetical protein